MLRIRKAVLLVLLSLLAFASTADAAWWKRFRIYTSAATDTTAVGMADSSSVMPTASYDRLYLHIKPSRPCRVAIQIRKHAIADSTNASMNDTTQVAIWPWRSITPTTTTVDTLSLSQTILPTSVVPASNELCVTFPADGVSKWGSSRGLYIPLRGSDGEWYSAPNTSVRVRVLSASGVVTWVMTLECEATR